MNEKHWNEIWFQTEENGIKDTTDQVNEASAKKRKHDETLVVEEEATPADEPADAETASPKEKKKDKKEKKKKKDKKKDKSDTEAETSMAVEGETEVNEDNINPWININ